MIHYTITPDNPASHLFSVSLSFNAIVGTRYTLSLPAWLPGSYMIRDFAKNIGELSAKDQLDNEMLLEKVDKQSWHITANTKKITLSYKVFAFDLSVRTAYLDLQRGFFNGSSTFIQIEELANQACSVELCPPKHTSHWRVATGLTRATQTEKYAFGLYHASSYHELIDCPVAIGKFDSFEFEVNGTTHHCVFTSEHFGDNNRLASDLEKICLHHQALFGETPFDEYWFITHLLEDGFGGLEHKNSTVLQASRFDLANPNTPDKVSEGYQTFLSLCSHEYFHAWNVCRIKPAEFTPYNLQQEAYTEQLWAYEGITSYYDDFSLFRCGIISFETYLETLAKTATRVFRGNGELKQSVCESSFYAWTKFYQQGPDAINNIVSYYTKGALIAVWLDLTIREVSEGKHSLDHVMALLWQQFGKTDKGTKEQDFFAIIDQVAGKSISHSLQQILHSKQRVPIDTVLSQVGVRVSPQKYDKLNSVNSTVTSEYRPFIGALFKPQALGVKITQVIEHSPAANAGLAVNDILISINNLKVTEQSLQKLAEHLPEGSETDCLYFRDDQLLQGQLNFIDSPITAIGLSVADQQQSQRWSQIL